MSRITPANPQTHQTFEDIKHIDAQGNEFWYARALAKVLDYSDFRNFLDVIEKAFNALEQSNMEASDHIGEVTEMVAIGSGAQRPMKSFALSRHACYLIVQNADPSKPVIANGQVYFAIQARRQELADDATFQALEEDKKRLFLRNKLKLHNKQLVEAAAQAGVNTDIDFAVFQNHGYKGLYGGLDAKGIHNVKGLKKSSTTWATPSSPPTYSAPLKPKKNSSATKSATKLKPTVHTLRSDKKSAKPYASSAAPCPKTCPHPIKALSELSANSKNEPAPNRRMNQRGNYECA